MKDYAKNLGIALIPVALAGGVFFAYGFTQDLRGLEYFLFGTTFGLSLYTSGIFAEKAYQARKSSGLNKKNAKGDN